MELLGGGIQFRKKYTKCAYGIPTALNTATSFFSPRSENANVQRNILYPRTARKYLYTFFFHGRQWYVQTENMDIQIYKCLIVLAVANAP
jgi:hypothetical protein